MGKSVLFIHSAGPQGNGEGSSGLVAHLEKSLEGYEVRSPPMPAPENPRYEEWKAVLKEEIFRMPDGALLIGHSIGGSALLKFFLEEEGDCRFDALISIAAPFWGIDKEWMKEDFTIAENAFLNRKHLPLLFLFHSLHDEVVPFRHLERYAEQLPDALIECLDQNDHLFLQGLPLLSKSIKNM
ncbi:alpha/beta hydrolase [Planomicrobium sp. CPCC 101079]|uniref:alpha/beta hydrolase n=1 Tax=Planomicrobium sp. CPCC 101079 TaxID=2599618 RepID=UPI0011B536E0|nr:alpha/beta hydrolase [Planomicrobium sp. CPCC 101079]TWT14610.1 serine hydrolase family protein [Planomicrobium sp. CPCC 101079]